MNLIQDVVLEADQTKWKIVIQEMSTSVYSAVLWKATGPQGSYSPVDKIVERETPQKAFDNRAKVAMQKEKKTPEISNPLGNTFLSNEDIGRTLESILKTL